jgi:hypothetical protein
LHKKIIFKKSGPLPADIIKNLVLIYGKISGQHPMENEKLNQIGVTA